MGESVGGKEPCTALVVVVPEAEPIVGGDRERLDVNAPLGVPAHVSVLFPFVPVRGLDSAVTARLARVFRGLLAFDAVFSRTGWFSQGVLYLEPEDPAPFRALTSAAFAQFPDHPPYEGVYEVVVPHLTIGHGVPIEDLRQAESAIAPRLPLRARVDVVSLLVQAPSGHWSVGHRFALGV